MTSTIRSEVDKTVVLIADGPPGGSGLLDALRAALDGAADSLVFRVVEASGESEAARCLSGCRPALVVADVDRCGLETLRKVVSLLRTDASRCAPVLAVLEPKSLPALAEVLESEVMDFLLKPVQGAELRTRVRLSLRRAAAMSELHDLNAELTRRSITDALTGLYNLGYLIECCDREIGRAKRHGHSVSCLLIDVDSFKRVNDFNGHAVGHRVLQELAALLRASVRSSDVVGRYGGEEFLVVLPHTDLEGAMILAERLRSLVAGHTFAGDGRPVRITVSVGVSVFPGIGVTDRETLLSTVDQAMYRAKALGRNRVARLDPDGEGDGLD
ncbi:MAG: diguanylate cyclase [Bacillota bacterium]|jgi:diguanylate cyclase (GGDEF)-like protein